MSASKPVLYSYWRSSCSWRVRIALGLKGVEFETRPVNLLKGEQRGEEYLAINPSATVPAIAFPDGLKMSDSIGIMAILDRKFPDSALLVPKDDALAAKVWQVSLLIHSGIQPIQNLKVLSYVETEVKGDKAAWAKHWITVGFQALEALLEKTAGSCCVGDSPSMADACLVPQVFNARRFGVDVDAFPVVSRVDAHLAALDAFKAADASRQPDTPEEHKAA